MIEIIAGLLAFIFALIMMLAKPTPMSNVSLGVQREIVNKEVAVDIPEQQLPVEPEEPLLLRSNIYAEIEISDDEYELLAKIAYEEARGEGNEGMRAVIEVVLNRVLSDLFPDTITEVIYQQGQFTPAKRLHKTQPTEAQYNAGFDVIYGTELILPDTEYLYFSTGTKGSFTLGNHTFRRRYK